MTLPGFITRNALRNKRRFALTVGSVAVSIFLLTVLQVLLRGFTDPSTTEHSAARLVARHKVSLANMLPAKYQTRIEALPGVAACTRLLWFGGVYRDEKNFFPQFACDAKSLFRVLSEARISPEERNQFVRERGACVVGEKTMQRFGWKRGDHITLLGAMWPCDPELTIRGVFSGSLDDTMLFFHHDYLDELLGDKGFTGLFWIRAENTAAAAALIEQIEAMFANSDAEIKSEMEHTFQLGFVSMLGNIKALIGSISTVIVFSLVLVTGGTMSMAIRERGPELAILKVLGYRGGLLAGLLVAESLGLAMAGGVAGSLTAWLALRVLDLQQLSHGLFVSFNPTLPMLARSLLVAAALGVACCVWPAWSSLRRPAAEGLRRPD